MEELRKQEKAERKKAMVDKINLENATRFSTSTLNEMLITSERTQLKKPLGTENDESNKDPSYNVQMRTNLNSENEGNTDRLLDSQVRNKIPHLGNIDTVFEEEHEESYNPFQKKNKSGIQSSRNY